jgi:branched-chain amino acid transport system substrate-binding protein
MIRRILLLSLLAPFLLATAARAAEPEFSGDIVVGASFPLTGIYESYGQSAYYGAVARVRAINENGGVNGKRLVVEWRDNKSNPELSTVQIEEFARDRNFPAVIGPLLSDSAEAMRELTEKYRFVAITPMATRSSLVRRSGWIFRACSSSAAQAEGLIQFQTQLYGADSVGILYDPRHTFSTELANVFAGGFTRSGGKVAASLPLLDDRGEKDYATPLRRLAELKPDFIFAPLYALEAVEMMQALKALSITIRVCGSDTWDNELVFDASGRRLGGTSFASSLFERSFNYPPFQEFFDAMERAGMENPDAQAAYAWDAVSMLAEAFKTGETAEELRKGLEKIENMELATGSLTILPNHESRKPVLVRVIAERRNKLVPVFMKRFDP